MSNETEQALEQDATAEDWAAAMDEQDGNGNDGGDADGDGFQQVAAQHLNKAPNAGKGEVKLDVILDIPVTIAMEIGRTQLSIRNLLQLNQGSIVELDRLAGEPMDVLVNGTLVAHGEVVVVNEKFGIRLTDVVSPADRIKNLR
ncbi:MAG: flagellar motor switch protein FliN [Gammaproteobacteria bacterium]|nr:flagellar motor switch protein FliN [Gammaproteobacteria bacterium]MDH3537751.1 flagellar motor switch protein FliN [Gammaproteobacteria bacterium]